MTTPNDAEPRLPTTAKAGEPQWVHIRQVERSFGVPTDIILQWIDDLGLVRDYDYDTDTTWMLLEDAVILIDYLRKINFTDGAADAEGHQS